MIQQLFKSLLGQDGAKALSLLLKTELSSYVTPRVIVSWLRQCSQGAVRVPDGCPLNSLNKSEQGFSGSCDINGLCYPFSDNSEAQVAAVIITSLGIESTCLTTRNDNLAKLGRTIDRLVKSTATAEAHLRHTAPDRHVPAIPSTPAVPPQQPLPPPKRIPSTRRAVKRSIRVTKTESLASCSSCNEKLFRNGEFTGCDCFSPIAKSVRTNLINDSYTLTLGQDWDDDDYLALVNVLKYGAPNG